MYWVLGLQFIFLGKIIQLLAEGLAGAGKAHCLMHQT